MAEKSHLTRRKLLTGLACAACGMAGFGAFSHSLRRDAGGKSEVALQGKEPQGSVSLTTNPRNGDKVSLLGFGCMRYPVKPGEHSPRSPNIDEKAAFELVDRALDHGVNYFDTAWGYHNGASQLFTGKALKRHPRSSFFLATKMPGYLRPNLAKAKEMFETQLKNCQVEYFDYYLLHNLSLVQNYQQVYEKEKILDYLLEEKKRGRIRNLGWSFHGDAAMLEYVLSRQIPWDFAMVQLNYHDLMHELVPNPFIKRNVPVPAPTRWMFEKLTKTNLPLVIMEPLLGGRLARLNGKAVNILKSERPLDSAASWAFRYVAGLPNVLTVLSGMTYLEHLYDNISTFSPYTPLSQREQALLKKALDAFVVADNIRCTTCGYCMPCPYGVDIPAVFRHHNDCLDDDAVPKDELQKSYASERKLYLNSLTRRIPELATASHCTGCGQCLPLCPQFIDIPAEMAKLGAFERKLRSV